MDRSMVTEYFGLQIKNEDTKETKDTIEVCWDSPEAVIRAFENECDHKYELVAGQVLYRGVIPTNMSYKILGPYRI